MSKPKTKRWLSSFDEIKDLGEMCIRDSAPQTPEEAWNPLFVEALQKKPYTEYLLDILLSGSMEERACVVAEYGKEVRKIERRISEFTASHPAGRHERSRSPVSYTHLRL